MKYCSHCGTQVEDDTKFCPNCGGAIEDNTAQAQPTPASSAPAEDKPFKGKAIGIIFSLFLSLIGLILCCILGDEPCRKAAIKTFIIVAIVEVLFVILWIVLFTVIGINAANAATSACLLPHLFLA